MKMLKTLRFSEPVAATLYFAAFIVATFYILYLFDLFGYKFFQDTVVLFEQTPTYFFSGSFASARFLLEPYTFLLDIFGINIDQYYRYSGFDFVATNEFFTIVNSIVFFSIVYLLKIDRSTLRSVLIIIFFYLLYIPYIGVPGKETNTLLLGAILYFFGFSSGKFKYKFLAYVFIMLYALGGRYYYLPFMLFLTVLQRFYITRPRFVMLIPFLILLVIAHFPVVTDWIRYARPDLTDESNTYISFVFDDATPFGFIINRLYLLIDLLFPVQLLTTLRYLPYFVFGILTTYQCMRVLINKSLTAVPPAKLFSAQVIIVFIFVQALFEPDMGSIFRHRSFLLPFILVLFLPTNPLQKQ